MNKKNIKGYIILGILLIVFTVIAFVIPFQKNSGFWMAYIFGLIAILFQIYVFKISLAKNGDAKSKFYGFPIAKIGVVYLGVQIVLSFAEMTITLTNIPMYSFTVINIVILAVAIAGVISADSIRNEIVQQEKKLKANVTSMRKLQSMAQALVEQYKDTEMKSVLQDIADKLKYSDPVTSDATEAYENELLQQLTEIQNAIIENDKESVDILAKKFQTTLVTRNSECKLNK